MNQYINLQQYYTPLEIKTIFYPFIFNITKAEPNGNGDVRMEDVYLPDFTWNFYYTRISYMNDIHYIKFLRTLFRTGNNFHENYALEFCNINNIKMEDFKIWYISGNHNSKINKAIRRLLRIGILTLPSETLNTNELLLNENGELDEYDNSDISLFIDGDNMYVHGMRLYQIKGLNFFSSTFFKRDAVSPYISVFASDENTDNNNYLIESYGIEKDAADVNLNEVIVTLKRRLVESRKYNNEKSLNIFTGDKYAEEIRLLTNHYFQLNGISSSCDWINTQPINYNVHIDKVLRENKWAFDPNHFPIETYGPLLFRKYDDQSVIKVQSIPLHVSSRAPLDFLNIDITNINGLLQGNQYTINNFIGDNKNIIHPIASDYLIKIIKYRDISIGDLSVQKLLRYPNVDNYTDFINLLNNLNSLNDIDKSYLFSREYTVKDLAEEYLVIMGSKILTSKEICNNFYNIQYQAIQSLKGLRPQLYRIDKNNEMFNILISPPDKLNILGYFYPMITHYLELYYKIMDVDIALGIKSIGFNYNPNIDYDENTQDLDITYFDIFI